jgi:hypothetical protein
MDIRLLATAAFLQSVDGDSTGSRWRVRIIKFGLDLNNIYWDRDSLAAALGIFDGMKVFALKESQHSDRDKRFGKSTWELVGAVSKPSVESDGIYGEVIILPSGAWITGDLKACQENGIPFVYGLSVDIRATTRQIMVDGRQVKAPAIIKSGQLDVVYEPAAGGEFLTQLAAARQGQEEEDMLKKLLAALQSTRPELVKQIEEGIAAGAISDDQAINMVAASMVEKRGGDSEDGSLVAAVVAGIKEAFGRDESDQVREIKLLACKMTLDAELTASRLPEAAQKTIRDRFEGQVFETGQLQAAIKSTKELIDAVTGTGQVEGAGQIRVVVGRESVEKFQAACDMLLGVEVASDLRNVPKLAGLRAAYVEMTGDSEITGVLDPRQLQRMQAAYGLASFSYVLGNTLYRRLVSDYREWTDYGVSRLVGNNYRNAVDFRNMESILIGYYGDLPTVNTDNEDYPDLGEVTDERVEYALLEKGGIITINRKMIINDDLRSIQRIISRLPRAARRTVAKLVWTPFISNSNWDGDSKAIFHADHANLGSTAYGITSAEAARKAMFKQTEGGSLEVLGLRPVTVAFPSDLRAIVTNVNNFSPQAVEIANGNSMYGYFKPEGLLENPFMTDATDWMMFADPNEIEIVELAFLNGQREPQMLVADNPAVGQMFVGNRIQYRITHDCNAEVVDYRGTYKAVVA